MLYFFWINPFENLYIYYSTSNKLVSIKIENQFYCPPG